MKQDGLKDKLYLNHLWTAWYGNSMKDLVEKPKVQWMGCTYLIPNLIEKLPEWEIFEHYCKLQASLMQARRRWSSRPPFPPNFLSEQQNIFSKTFQFVTIKFFVFFRTNERNQNKKKNLRGCGSFAKKEEIDRHVHKLRWRNKHLSRLIYVDIWNQEYVENILFDFFVIQEMWYAIVLQTVYNEWIIFGVSFVNKWKCLIPKKKKLVFPSNTWETATAATTTATTTAKWPLSYRGDPKC